jgi:STE24 endopeptidase
MAGEKIEKLFWVMLTLWALLRLTLMGAQLTGNTNPDYIARVKQYFTRQQIDEGKNYALSGFWLKAFYGFAYVGLLAFLLKTGFFAALYNRILARVGYGLFKSEILFVIAFLLLLRLISLPYSFYMGFIRETNMGFSNLTALGWFFKYCKSALVGVGLEAAGILLLLAVVRQFSVNWVYIVPLAMSGFSIAVTLIYPVLITPIFYNKQPLHDQQLRARLLNIGRQSGMQIEEIFVVDESRYSKHTNAYFTGVGRYRRIVLYDNLMMR